MNNIQEKLLAKIQSGEIQMVPRWQFVLRGVLWAALTLLVGLLSVYLFSFIVFALRESGVLFAPFFGWAGMVMFVVSSPWILISVLGVFLVALYALVSHYSFSYKKPLVYSMIGVVFAVIAVASIIEQFHFHDRAGAFVERHGVPGLVPLYKNIDAGALENLERGTISEISDSGFTMQSRDGSMYTVAVTPRTKMPKKTALEVGESVMVFGPKNDDSIEAFGVRIDDGRRPGVPGEPAVRGIRNMPPVY